MAFPDTGPAPSLAELPRVLCSGHLVLVRALELADPSQSRRDLIGRERQHTRTLLASWPPRSWDGRLVILDGEPRRTLYWALTQGFERAEVAADLRLFHDRRPRDGGEAHPGRPGYAGHDRRLAPPRSWGTLGLVVTPVGGGVAPVPAELAVRTGIRRVVGESPPILGWARPSGRPLRPSRITASTLVTEDTYHAPAQQSA
jgi:hypothetical protein